MKNRVRIECDQNVVKNAGIFFLRGPDDEWVDVRDCVRSATVTMTVGELSRAHLELLLVDASVEALRVSDESLAALAATLTAHGWTVSPPGEG